MTQKETTMNEDNIYRNMPWDYALCFTEGCELAENCLRHLAAKYGNSSKPIVRTVNPRVNSGGKSCPYYRPKKTVTVAYGMLHTFDKVLAADIANIRRTLKDYFRNTSYYLRRNGEHAISPEEQQFVNAVFREHGYPDGAVFDRYVEELAW